jgi:hypothetical protein
LSSCEAQEDRLIKLAVDGALAATKLRERLEQVSLKKAVPTEKLQHTEERLHYGAELVLAYVDMLPNPIEFYNRVPDSVRRDLLGAMFTQLIVHAHDDELTIESERTEMNRGPPVERATQPRRRLVEAGGSEESPSQYCERLYFDVRGSSFVQRLDHP